MYYIYKDEKKLLVGSPHSEYFDKTTINAVKSPCPKCCPPFFRRLFYYSKFHFFYFIYSIK